MNSQTDKSPPLVIEEKKIVAPQAASEAGPLTEADYVYRIAAVTAGIIFLATVV